MSNSNSILPDRARQIEDAPLGYCVTHTGVVWSNRPHRRNGTVSPWHTIKLYVSKDKGYVYFNTKHAGETLNFLVHRLVLEAFVGPCPPGLECRHLDGNPGNNLVSNLEWGTHASNEADKKRHGRTAIGERSGTSKLHDQDILTIFRLSREGFSQVEIAKIYGMSQTSISLILIRKIWSHVQIPDEHIYIPRQHPELAPKGERNGLAKMTNQAVVDVFRLYREGSTQEEIAEIHGMSQSSINSILHRQTWSHVLIPAKYLPPG
jgi:hypothetical protein